MPRPLQNEEQTRHVHDIKIPISFEWEGMLFEGCFEQVLGGGGSWHLSLYNYHYGQLVKYSDGWKWCPSGKKMFDEPFMEKFFIEVVTAWLIV